MGLAAGGAVLAEESSGLAPWAALDWGNDFFLQRTDVDESRASGVSRKSQGADFGRDVRLVFRQLSARSMT